MEKDLKTEKERLINEVANLISNPKYLADIGKHFANPEYLSEVRRVFKSFLENGYNKEKMIKDLGEYMLKLRAEGRDNEEDLVLEALSFLDGWGGPNSQL
jgi:hypothetical protein